MSKSKKNTIDPEKIIEMYGADSARLFILSDSPPEKDVQWSDEGIASSYKFIQKLWSLNEKVIHEIEQNHEEDEGKDLIKFTNKYLKKMTDALNAFSYNILIANLHEMQNFFNKELIKKYTKKTLTENFSKILVTMIPIIPHLANECLKRINYNVIEWPEYDETLLVEDIIPYVIQVNGKKRAIIEAKRDILDEELFEIVQQNKNLKKYFSEKEIKKKIFVPNRLINIIA